MKPLDKYQIEQIYDDLLVAEAELLFGKQAIIDQSKPEKSLYVFTVHDGKDLEVEIFKPFTKVQKSTCPCTFHQNHSVCKHVIACLFFVRDSKRSSGRKKQEVTVRKPKKLNTYTLLQHVEREELIQFVRQYAKSDSKFALQLKIHFAKKVDLPDNREKYAQLLDSIIKPHTGKSTPGQAELRAFLKVTDELLGQMEDSIALEQYEEAFHMLQAGYYKFCYVRHYHGMDSDVFQSQNGAWLDAVKSLLEEKIPYSLKKQIKDFLLELSFMSFYRYDHPVFHVLYILKPHFTKKELDQSLQLLSGHISNLKGDEKLTTLTLMIYLSGKISESVKKLVHAPGFQAVTFFKKLLLVGMVDIALAEMQELTSKKVKNPDLFLLLSENYQKEGKIDQAIDTAVQHFGLSGQLTSLFQLKEAASEVEWEHHISQELEKKILAAEHIKPVFVASFLHWLQKWDTLYHFILTQGEVFPYLKSLADMSKHRPEEAENVVFTYAANYLKDHIGEKSQEHIKLLFSQLETQKLYYMRKGVAQFIIKSFPERKALVQWLESI